MYRPEAIRILCVDDERVILTVHRGILEGAGYEVWTAESAAEALAVVRRRGLPHLALLDLHLPEWGGGLELGRELQGMGDVPIIVVSSVEDDETIVRCLDDLCDDFISKRRSAAELLARIARLLRRIGDFSYTFAPRERVDPRLEVELARSRVVVDGITVDLTPTENRLLYLLMRSAGATVPTDYLLSRLWPGEAVFEDTLRVHVHRLRRKIEPIPSQPRYVVTRRGEGYAFPLCREASSGSRRVTA